MTTQQDRVRILRIAADFEFLARKPLEASHRDSVVRPDLVHVRAPRRKGRVWYSIRAQSFEFRPQSSDRVRRFEGCKRRTQSCPRRPGRIHRCELDALAPEAAADRLCELNVMEQVLSVGETTIVQSAWDRGKALEVHGWIYDLHDGLLKDLGVTVGNL